MNRAQQTHSTRSSSLGRQESPFCRAAAAAFLGMARPAGGEGGREGKLGVVLPSFLSLKSKSLPRGGARSAARAGSAVSLLGSAVHVGFRRRDPARRHFLATAAEAGA